MNPSNPAAEAAKARALLKFGTEALYAMRFEEAEATLTQAVELAKAARQERLHARSLARLLNVLGYLGKAESLRPAIAQAGMDHVTGGQDEVAGLIIQGNFVRFLDPGDAKAANMVKDFIKNAARHAQDPDIARASGQVALVCNAMGDAATAAKLLERALPVLEAALGEGSPEVGLMLYNLADLRGSIDGYRNLAQIEPMYRRAVAIQKAALAPGHPERVMPLMMTGWLLAKTSRFEEARQLLDEALSIAVAVEGEQGQTPQMVRQAREALEDQYLEEPAEAYLLKLLEAAQANPAAEPLEVATRLTDVCRNYFARGLSKSADPHYRKLRAIAEGLGELEQAVLRAEMGITAKTYILLKRDKGAVAEKLLVGELETMERVLPAGHEEWLRHLYFTGNVFRMMERHADALKCFERYVEAERQRGEADPGRADGLARLLDAQLQLGKSEAAGKTAREIERLTGKKPVMDPALAEIARQLNNVWFAQGIEPAPDLVGAALKRDPVASLAVALCFAVGLGVPPDMDKAGPWFRIAAEANDPLVEQIMEELHQRQDGDEPVDFGFIAAVAKAWFDRSGGPR